MENMCVSLPAGQEKVRVSDQVWGLLPSRTKIHERGEQIKNGLGEDSRRK